MVKRGFDRKTIQAGDMSKIVEINDTQKSDLEDLWFVYGNNGKHHTHANHRFIQCLIDERKDYRDFFKPTLECIKAVEMILETKV